MQWTIRLLDCHGAAYSVSAAEPWPQEARKVRQNTVWQADGEGAQGMWDHGCRDSMLRGTTREWADAPQLPSASDCPVQVETCCGAALPEVQG